MPRKLRIAVSVFFGLATVTLCVLWVWSDANAIIIDAINSSSSSVAFDQADKVIIVRPYSDLKRVGFDNADGVAVIDSAVSESEGINLLVLIDSNTNRVLAWADVPRTVIDFPIEDPSETVQVDESHRHWVDALKARSKK